MGNQMKVINNTSSLDVDSREAICNNKSKQSKNIVNNICYQSSVSSYSASKPIIGQTSRKSIVSFTKVHFARESYISIANFKSSNNGIFGKMDVPVFMTLSNKISRYQTSSTQATASINKCFQVCDEWKNKSLNMNYTNSDFCSTCTMSTLPCRDDRKNIPIKLLSPNVYFFGRKKEDKPKGMGSKSQKTNQATSTAVKSEKENSKSSVRSSSSTSVKNSSNVSVSKPKPNLPPKTSKGAATASGTSKSVTIKDDKEQKPCPALGTSKGDMMVTVSHIKIGPKETCPVHGSEPCQGPKCILASSGIEQGPVKVTTASNPRRGVFEIVIRKLTGAPLAKNELMLEWTLPPSRQPPCNATCPSPYAYPAPCSHSKCKLMVCRPSSPCRSCRSCRSCKPKCCKKVPCGQPPYRLAPCKKCSKPACGSPCRPCKPCYPIKPPCLTLPCKIPCSTPCARPQCAVACKSSPCLRPCPVSRKRTVRKARSQPRIKSHRKKTSPCHNRSKTCPVVRCRSTPGPCCKIRPICLPRRCCSISPCKPPNICVSSCSSPCE